MEANQLANMGLAFRKLQDMTKAEEYWKMALEIFEAMEDPRAERVRNLLEER